MISYFLSISGGNNLSGKHITQQQVTIYMSQRQRDCSQELSSAKAGISIRSGRRIEKDGKPAPIKRHWKTRKDPFESVWAKELEPLLLQDAEITGMTLWEYLDDNYPSKYPEKLLRTLQRRVKHWRATQGPDKAVIFCQSVPAGHQGLSDFTHPNTKITIAGKPFAHLLYQFRLANSGWRHVHIVKGGESYSALADGLQNALHLLGGTPKEHRTDSLSAAYVNQTQKKKLTTSYEALCQHYGMVPTTNNLGVSHENGAIETANGSLKHRIAQAIKIRGSHDFSSVAAYRDLIAGIVKKLNRRCKGRLAEEQKKLRPLPRYRFIDYIELSVKVTRSSTIAVKRGLYTVPSRLIGETLKVHLYHDRLDCYVGQTKCITLSRVYPKEPSGRARRINYRHLINSLAAKPQAFRFSQFRNDILPNDNYHQLWLLAEQQFSPKDACKWVVTLLRLAHEHDCEAELAITLLSESDKAPLPELHILQSRYLHHVNPPDIPLRQHTAQSYDELLQGNWLAQEVRCV